MSLRTHGANGPHPTSADVQPHNSNVPFSADARGDVSDALHLRFLSVLERQSAGAFYFERRAVF